MKHNFFVWYLCQQSLCHHVGHTPRCLLRKSMIMRVLCSAFNSTNWNKVVCRRITEIKFLPISHLTQYTMLYYNIETVLWSEIMRHHCNLCILFTVNTICIANTCWLGSELQIFNFSDLCNYMWQQWKDMNSTKIIKCCIGSKTKRFDKITTKLCIYTILLLIYH